MTFQNTHNSLELETLPILTHDKESKDKDYGTQFDFNIHDVLSDDDLGIAPHTENRRPSILKLIGIGLLLLTGGLGILFMVRRLRESTSRYNNESLSDMTTKFYIQKEYGDGVLDICQMSEVSSLCDGNLGISRRLMPQLKHSVAQKYYDKKREEGFEVVSRELPPDQLLPVQKEIFAEKIIDMWQRYDEGGKNPCLHEITVSSYNEQNRVIDGMHHKTTCQLIGKGNQHFMSINDSVKNMMDELQNFDGVIYSNTNAFFKSPRRSDKHEKIDRNVSVSHSSLASAHRYPG